MSFCEHVTAIVFVEKYGIITFYFIFFEFVDKLENVLPESLRETFFPFRLNY